MTNTNEFEEFGRGVRQRGPKSWVDKDGHEWCYECHERVFFFKEGWYCSDRCPIYLTSWPAEERGGDDR